MADNVVDSLELQVSAQANNAEASLDRLARKLTSLTTSLRGVSTHGIDNLARSVKGFAGSMQSMNAIKTTDFSRLVRNVNKLASANTNELFTVSRALNQMVNSFNRMGTVTENAQNIGVLANNISKLGYKKVTDAITNLPLLTIELNNLLVTLSKAPTVSTNVIQMTNALANLATQGSKVGTASSSLVRGLNRYTTASSRASKSTFSLAAAFGKFYASYFLIIRGLKGVWSSIESTADYIEAYNYYNVAFGKIASDWESDWEKYGYQNGDAYAQSFTDRMNDVMSKFSGVQIDLDTGLLSETGMKNLGMNIQEVTQFASQLASVTNSVGQVGEVSLATAESITRLAGDISSLFNVDFKEVATNLQSGLIGQSRALYKYGIDITQATLQTYAFGLGLEKSVSEMTQAEKMQLRLIAILDQSKVSWGDLANTIQSPSNQIRILSNNIAELGTVFGQLFIPMLSKVLPYVNGLTIALKRLFVNLASFMGIEIDLDAFGQGYNDSLDDTAGEFEDVADSIEKTNKALRGFDELKTITSATKVTGADTGSGAIDLTDEIIKATGEYEKAWDEAFAKMENNAQDIADILTVKFENAGKVLKDLVPALEGIGTALVTYKIVTGISNLASAIATGFGPAAGVAIGVGVIVSLASAINEVWKEMKQADFEDRFGDITLSAQELEEVAKAIIENKNLEQIGTLLSEVGENADITKNIEKAVKKLDQMNWKVSIGMALTEDDEASYKSAIQSYISNMNSLIDNEQYSVSMGISLFLGNSAEGSAVQNSVDAFYNSQRASLNELGQKLNEAVNSGWEDGLFDIDEAKAVMDIQKQMADIQNSLISSQTMAKLQLLEADYSGAELTPDAYKKLAEQRQKLLDEYKSDLNEALTYTIAGVNVSKKAEYDAALTEQERNEIQKQWDEAISELITGRDTQVTDMMLKSLSFDYNTVADTFGSELDSAYKTMEKYLDVFFNEYSAYGVDALDSAILSHSGSIFTAMKKYAGKEGAENFSEIIDLMIGSDKLEETAQSVYEQTGEIPKAVMDALSSSYALEAISGSMESLYKYIYLSADSKAKDDVLEVMKKNGQNVPKFFSDGVIENEELATDSLSTFLESLSSQVDTFSLYDEMYSIGKDALQGFYDAIELAPSSGNFVPIDTSKFDSSWKSNLPKINTTTQSFPGVPLSESTLKDFQAAMREKVELDVKLSVEPNEREFVKVAIDGINQKTISTGRTPIALAY